ncbi:hypothetical protein ABKV19_013729 [Rosa sericea]
MAGDSPTKTMTWSRIQGKYIWRNRKNTHRFIPNREALDLDYASYIVAGGSTAKEILQKTERSGFSSNVAYQKLLAEALNMNRTRIFSYKKPQIPPKQISSPPSAKEPKKPRHIEILHKLDAPDLEDDFSLNLLDWGTNNVVAIAIQDSVFLWNASNKSSSEIELGGLVTSVSWGPGGDDESVMLWNVFMEVPKPVRKEDHMPFAHSFYHVR